MYKKRAAIFTFFLLAAFAAVGAVVFFGVFGQRHTVSVGTPEEYARWCGGLPDFFQMATEGVLSWHEIEEMLRGPIQDAESFKDVPVGLVDFHRAKLENMRVIARFKSASGTLFISSELSSNEAYAESVERVKEEALKLPPRLYETFLEWGCLPELEPPSNPGYEEATQP